MDLALILLIVAVIALGGAVALKDTALLWAALGHSGKLLGTVWLDLLLGFAHGDFASLDDVRVEIRIELRIAARRVVK